ncbi:MAG TPA: hypothetical protein VNO83_14105 [Pseudonocardia sp.]|nr:hypothetical protein [Pseudonocardia sp.]
MSGRDPHESGRTATPLELLFDLTFVVAFGFAGNEAAHANIRGMPSYGPLAIIALGEGIIGTVAALSAVVEQQGMSVVICLLLLALAPAVTVVGYETIGHRHQAELLERG